ncbi:hypothetical protein HYH03_008057 [Edaphochlamys debaryana]|uniref:F-box domain-containing protein n=1 Tax=Edaphochlamys debaryana TaxID=47281 RepID=A0A836BYH8_9CHLO|nr:hypothetical protein HYH03_008057 [Edaphochlamys debaryana]|eukprot:KAG2493841.1 hypothetical protein HYH03_008057 [Edaphochlamys debaryana]
MDEEGQPGYGGFGDPPADIADRIVDALAFSPKALLRLSETNTFWNRVVRDPRQWTRLCVARFGAESQPPPAQPATHLPGWVFFPGVDSPGNDTAAPAEGDAASLRPEALARKADECNGVAFNTNGWVKRSLLPANRWSRFSLEPGAGLYVREEAVVQVLGMAPRPPLPEQADPEASPPQLTGWVLYPLMDSPGHDIRHPCTSEPDFLSSCASLEDLEAVARAFPGCVAFNTNGQLKRDLEPQVHWRRMGGSRSSWSGLYVRRHVVEEAGLLSPLSGTGLDPRMRFFQRGHTRLLAARDVDVVWLNGTYLARRADPDHVNPQQAQHGPGGHGPGPGPEHDDGLGVEGGSVASDDSSLGGGSDEDGGEAAAAAAGVAGPEVVVLNNVCWLQLNGVFRGLGPGRYRAVWLLRVSRDCNITFLNFKVRLEAQRPCDIATSAPAAAPSPRPAATAAVPLAGGAAPVAGAVADAGGAGGSASAAGEASPGDLDTREIAGTVLQSHAGAGWYEQIAGEFAVPPGWAYDVVVDLWNHDSWWKRGLMFKELVLVQLDE